MTEPMRICQYVSGISSCFVHTLKTPLILGRISLAGTLVRTGDQGREAVPVRSRCGGAAG